MSNSLTTDVAKLNCSIHQSGQHGEWVSRFWTSAQSGYTVPFTLFWHNTSAWQTDGQLDTVLHESVWMDWKIQDRRQIKHTDNTQTEHKQEKAHNAKKNSKTKLPWFSHLMQHSARIQCTPAHTGLTIHTDSWRAVSSWYLGTMSAAVAGAQSCQPVTGSDRCTVQVHYVTESCLNFLHLPLNDTLQTAVKTQYSCIQQRTSDIAV